MLSSGSMMNASSMHMIIDWYAGFMSWRQQSHMQKVKGSPSWLLTLSLLTMVGFPLLMVQSMLMLT